MIPTRASFWLSQQNFPAAYPFSLVQGRAKFSRRDDLRRVTQNDFPKLKAALAAGVTQIRPSDKLPPPRSKSPEFVRTRNFFKTSAKKDCQELRTVWIDRDSARRGCPSRPVSLLRLTGAKTLLPRRQSCGATCGGCTTARNDLHVLEALLLACAICPSWRHSKDGGRTGALINTTAAILSAFLSRHRSWRAFLWTLVCGSIQQAPW